MLLTRVLVIAVLLLVANDVFATPQLARQYRVDCSHCHVAPPRLNARGLAFLISGYEGAEIGTPQPTVPIALWNTFDLERRHTADLTKGFPGRVELISVGTLPRTRIAYFAEWRAVSYGIGGNRRLLSRAGRFEDLFVRVPVSRGNTAALTVGQFRALTQVDVSLRLSVSEPLAFSSGVPTVGGVGSARLRSLRAFSPSGRQPGVRLEYQRAAGSSPDGWYGTVTLPLTGELTVPIAEAASFEFEARPKGVFGEAYRRWGLSSLGGHVFLGDDRRLGSVVVTHDVQRLSLIGSVGRFNAAGATDTRFSIGGEYTIHQPTLIAGVRVDDRTTAGQTTAVLIYGNVHVPFGPAAFRQALRLQVEQRVQRRNHVTAIALSHVF
ncbi:MAG TPA: hypothetical protein VMO26_19125 [Vicinamibacterales bacterium]|nr:hypothetical protein [Vicinamibacterales bacterium]